MPQTIGRVCGYISLRRLGLQGRYLRGSRSRLVDHGLLSRGRGDYHGNVGLLILWLSLCSKGLVRCSGNIWDVEGLRRLC